MRLRRARALLASAAAVAAIAVAPPFARGAATPAGLAGSWATTLGSDEASSVTIVLTFGPGTRFREAVADRAGHSYQLLGSYAQRGTAFRYRWTDYAPKTVCDGGGCRRALKPSEAGSSGYVAVSIRDRNHFIGRGPDGRDVFWTRVEGDRPVLPIDPTTT